MATTSSFTTLSLAHVRRHKPRALLTLVSVAAGVAAVVATSAVTGSVLSSFEDTIRSTARGADYHVVPLGAGVDQSIAETLARAIGIENASPKVTGFISDPDTPDTAFALVGIDLLADKSLLGGKAEEFADIRDTLEFIANSDSIALSADVASHYKVSIGKTIKVVSPTGINTLTVRGVFPKSGPLKIFRDGLAVMDIPAAQLVLGKHLAVDRVDVSCRPHQLAECLESVHAAVGTRARVLSSDRYAARAKGLLRSVRVLFALAGMVAVVVAFFIILHTVDISLTERRRTIGLLSATGASHRRILGWLSAEALVLAAIATTVGTLAGYALARVSLDTFGVVAQPWLRTEAATLRLAGSDVALAGVLCAATCLLATFGASARLLRRPTAALLGRGVLAPDPPNEIALRSIRRGMVCFAITAAVVWIAPATLPYAPLVALVSFETAVLLTGFGLMSPGPAFLIARGIERAASQASGYTLLIAARSVARHPAAAVAVTTGIIMAFAWTLANASLTESFKRSWSRWYTDHYQSDLVVTGNLTGIEVLNANAFPREFAERIRAIDGVARVQSVRRLEIDHEGHPVVLVSYSDAGIALPLYKGSGQKLERSFWRGEGVLVGRSLARRLGVREHDTFPLPTPMGTVALPVLGVIHDVYGGDLGAVAISDERFALHWNDDVVDQLRVWIDDGADPTSILAQMNATLGPTSGVRAVTFETILAGFQTIIDQAFTLTYALVFVSLVVSAVGIVNFLLSVALDRMPQYRTMHAAGMTPAAIALTVIAEAGIISAVASVVGMVAGVALSALIILHAVPMVNGWEFDLLIGWRTALWVAAGTLAIGLLSGVVPGWLTTRKAMVAQP